MSIFDLSGRTAVITGGNGGIGLGIAQALASSGCNVSIWGRNAEKNKAAAATMKKLGKNYEFHIYEHATHGFAEYQQLGGNPEAIKDSWARAIAFLKKYTR